MLPETLSPFGHDKSIEIRKYSSLPDSHRPTMFYAGDGVSDLSAAKETDLLFAKQGRGKLNPSSPLNRIRNKVRRSHQHADKGIDLIQYCIRENIPFIEFEEWSDILSTLKDIVGGKTDAKHVAVAGARKARHGK